MFFPKLDTKIPLFFFRAVGTVLLFLFLHTNSLLAAEEKEGGKEPPEIEEVGKDRKEKRKDNGRLPQPLASPAIKRDFVSERSKVLWSDFREKVEEVLLEYTLEELTQELAELNVSAQYIDGDIIFQGGAAYNYSIDPNNTAGALHKQSIKITPQISKKFLHTGTTIGISGGYKLGMSNLESEDITNTSTLSANLSIKQDLLQNFFGLLGRLSISDAQRQLDIAKEQRRLNERKLQQTYDQLYLNWILIWRMQVLLAEQLRKSTESLALARRQRSLNYIDNGTYQQIYNSHLTYRKTLLANERQLIQMDQRFARFLGEDLYKPDLEVLEPLLQEAKKELEPLHFEDSWVWSINQKSLEQADIHYTFSKLNRLPNLTLSGSIGLRSSSATYGSSEQPSYGDLEPTYSIALDLTWPILMRKGSNYVENSRIQLKKLEVAINKQRQEFEIDIANQRSGHQFLLENYQVQQETSKAKTAIYVSNEVKYRQARASIRDLLDAEIGRLSAELDVLRAENDLIKQVMDFRYNTREQDILQNRHVENSTKNDSTEDLAE